MAFRARKVVGTFSRNGPLGTKIAKCARINQRRNSLAIFAGDQNRRDRRIKSPSVSLALENVFLVLEILLVMFRS